MKSGPHHNSIGKELASRSRVVDCKVGDQVSGRPRGLFTQSNERIKSLICPLFGNIDERSVGFGFSFSDSTRDSEMFGN